MTEEKADIVIISNSPGELFSWVRMTANHIKQQNPNVRIVLYLVPCPFASGRESRVAGSYDSIDLVLTPVQFLKFVFLGILPREYRPAKKGVVVLLGGDYWHAAIASWRLKYPATAYIPRSFNVVEKYFDLFFCANEKVKKHLLDGQVPPGKLEVVGQLVVEGVIPRYSRTEGFEKMNLDEGKLTIGIFPGSRHYNMEDSLPVFLKVAEEVNEKLPDAQFLLGVSPFLDIEDIQKCVTNPRSPLPGSKGTLTNGSGGPAILTDKGSVIHIMLHDQYDLMNMADIVLTIPGTNTAECAYLGKPLVVVASWKARIPHGGLGILMNKLPLGKLRKSLMMQVLKKLKYTALPNLIADKAIVPEVKIENETSEITDVLLQLINDYNWRREMGSELKEIMGPSGAGEKISRTLLKMLD